jgi:hypothetical protein
MIMNGKHIRIRKEVTVKMTVFWYVAPVTEQKFTDVSEVLTASIIKTIRGARCNIPEDSHLHNRHRKNLTK